MDKHPSQRVNKALRKRFKMLCPKEMRNAYTWALIRLIGYTTHRPVELPKIKGDKELVRAWRLHANDLIKIYAPRVKLPCGHSPRDTHCEKCAEEAIAQFEEMENRRYKKTA